MKNQIFTLLFLIVGATQVVAQSQIGVNQPKRELKVSTYTQKEFFLGVGLGINAPTGALGIKMSMIKKQLGLELGAGLGTWGGRQTLNIFYKQDKRNPWCPGIGFSRGSGIDELEIEVTAVNQKTNLEESVTIPIFLSSSYAFNIFFQKNYFSKNGSRFAIDLGYSVGITDLNSNKIYSLNPNYKLTRESISAIRLISPGGLILGLSYNFGL